MKSLDRQTVYGRSEGELSENPFTRHLIGILGELAFAEHYDLQINSNNSWTDPGYDFLVKKEGDESQIEIKTTRFEGGDLFIPVGDHESDYYILTYVPDCESLDVQLLGGASGDMVANSPTEESEFYEKGNYSLKQHRLEDIPDQETIQPYQTS